MEIGYVILARRVPYRSSSKSWYDICVTESADPEPKSDEASNHNVVLSLFTMKCRGISRDHVGHFENGDWSTKPLIDK